MLLEFCVLPLDFHFSMYPILRSQRLVGLFDQDNHSLVCRWGNAF